MSSESDFEMSVIKPQGCQCQMCKTQRLYQKMHLGEKHIVSARRYYAQNREAMVSSKAYARYLKGIRPHKRTLIELMDAEFSIDPSISSKHNANLDAT
jgi:hypothetical protein